MNTCKICGEPAPEGEEFCWCCKHTKLHPTGPKPETEENEEKQEEENPVDHYEAIRHEFYQVWESIDELKRGHRLIEKISMRVKRWIQQLRSH